VERKGSRGSYVTKGTGVEEEKVVVVLVREGAVKDRKCKNP